MPNHFYATEKALEGRRKMIEHLDDGEAKPVEIFHAVKGLYNYYARPYQSFLNDLCKVRSRRPKCHK